MESIAGPSTQTFQKPAANLSNRIFLGNLSDDLEEAAIKSYCKTWGELVECRVMREPKSKKSRGFGFLAYKSDISASHFMNGRPHYIGDKKIDVKLVVPAIRVCEIFFTVMLIRNVSRDLNFELDFSRQTFNCGKRVTGNF